MTVQEEQIRNAKHKQSPQYKQMCPVCGRLITTTLPKGNLAHHNTGYKIRCAGSLKPGVPNTNPGTRHLYIIADKTRVRLMERRTLMVADANDVPGVLAVIEALRKGV